MKVSGQLRQYEIIGRKLPTEKEPEQPLYKMTIFAPNEVVAKSRFWYFLSQLKKMKRSTGQILRITRIHEKRRGVVRNYGIWLRYDSRSNTHNMYREYRDVSLANAVTNLYREMAARHRCRGRSIQIIRTDVIPASKCIRPHTKQFLDSKIKFPLPHRRFASQFKSRFVAKRPSTFFG
ncbi:ribosomal protein L18a [Salpingoeca rosetta]|uniref:60S ribosomal protein L18a n=1 Tax=Salpingoeca rosetta (strain ATCC 50818 / BSB-021) TaxID=946362 RepID=F2UIW2_SALR5|nr:ribosomal protein L18a [Salpingoeca rosetta]EGD77161.1 ribosomal protein L18a [Salpingoeca rosetta]|eukprot:XP_004991000.1 ribosomal protein L18a [Salpingoeca rosetta]